MRASRGARSTLSIESNGSAALAIARSSGGSRSLTTRRRLVRRRLPAFLAEQRHKTNVGEVLTLVIAFGNAGDAHQFLRARVAADRNYQPSADLELAAQRLGNLRAAGRNHDGIVGRVFGPAAGAVAVQHVHIGVALLGERGRRFFGECADAFDRVDLVGDLGEYRRRVAGAGADFEHLFPAFEQQRLGHQRDDVGLRNGLALGDRQRRIFIGEFVQVGGQEGLAGNLAHCLEDVRGSHPACGNIVLDHVFAQMAEVPLGFASCQRHDRTP